MRVPRTLSRDRDRDRGRQGCLALKPGLAPGPESGTQPPWLCAHSPPRCSAPPATRPPDPKTVRSCRDDDRVPAHAEPADLQLVGHAGSAVPGPTQSALCAPRPGRVGRLSGTRNRL
jgi:hypothetical protein